LPEFPAVKADTVAWRYIGAQTRQTVEKGDACAKAAAFSAYWIFRSEFVVFSALTVGYT
jgi:hypothetical protein